MTKRQYNIDALRLICAFLVVCIHCTHYSLREYILPITRVAVPIFFIISGYFLYSDNETLTKSRITKSIKKITKIYVISLVVFFIYALINGFITNNFNAVKVGPWKIFMFITNCSSLCFPYDFHLWFLIALIQGLILFHLVLVYIKRYTKISMIISLIFILFNPVLENMNINIMNKITFIPFSKVIFLSFPYLVIGYYIKYNHYKIVSKLLWIPLFIFAIFSIFEGSNHNMGNYFSTPFLSITVFYLFQGIKEINKKNIIEFLGKLGEKHSLFIYISHVIIIKLLNLMNCNTNPFVIFIISLLCSYLFSYIKNIKYELFFFKR